MNKLQLSISRKDEINLPFFLEIIHKQFEILTKQGIHYHLSYHYDSECINLLCQIEGGNDIKHPLSSSIAQFIVSCKETEILDELLCLEYGYKDDGERESMIQFILFSLNTDENGECCEAVRKNRLEQKIKSKVLEYLEMENELSLDGFIRFRLKEQWHDWREAIEYGIHEYLIDKECKEMMQRLRYFISNKENNLRELHVIHVDDRNLLLFDPNWNRLYPYLVNGISLKISNKLMYYEDLLLGVIVSMAPSGVTVHSTEENHAIVFTLKKIFAGKIQICHECQGCQKIKRDAHLSDFPTYQ